MTRTPTPEAFIGNYGRAWRTGVISDHLVSFVDCGGLARTCATGRLYAVMPDGYAYPILCSEIIEIPTEDGPVTGRCGLPVANDREICACDGHAQEIRGWLEMSEVEKLNWERNHG